MKFEILSDVLVWHLQGTFAEVKVYEMTFLQKRYRQYGEGKSTVKQHRWLPCSIKEGLCIVEVAVDLKRCKDSLQGKNASCVLTHCYAGMIYVQNSTRTV